MSLLCSNFCLIVLIVLMMCGFFGGRKLSCGSSSMFVLSLLLL